MPNVRADMTVKLDRFLCGVDARVLREELIELERFRVLDSPAVTHLSFRFPVAA
ncbi:hypothetical protein [Nocardia yamanashiensis]|uniref:hypothetical protein n=1 Tax=Nocardia yamanashiensis TaxID=209247 RepID=UPI000A8878AB|nr:hypothetical protein [Nocardia yamanashiensis]